MSSIRKYDIDLRNYRQLFSKLGQSHCRNGSKLAKKGSWGASGAPGGPNVGEESLLSVKVLLFRILSVVLLLVSTLATVYSPYKRYTALAATATAAATDTTTATAAATTASSSTTGSGTGSGTAAAATGGRAGGSGSRGAKSPPARLCARAACLIVDASTMQVLERGRHC